MATVTKLKAEVNNKNLPVITPSGEITNYYLGVFLNKIVEKGYTPSQTEIIALNTFIENAISNNYIDYIQYMLPFIGNSDNPFAGTVPLIDNVDNYAMSEYDGTEDYATLFEYDNSGKIISLHNTRNGQYDDYIKTPVTYEMQSNGFSIFMNVNIPTLTHANIPLLSQDVDDAGTYRYIRLRIQTKSNNFTTEIMTTATDIINVGNISGTQMNPVVTNNYNTNIGARYFEKENDSKIWGGSYAEFSGTKLIKIPARTNVDNWQNLAYGKYCVGRNMQDIHLKCMLFLDTNTPNSLYETISSNVFTLVRALGRA